MRNPPGRPAKFRYTANEYRRSPSPKAYRQQRKSHVRNNPAHLFQLQRHPGGGTRRAINRTRKRRDTRGRFA